MKKYLLIIILLPVQIYAFSLVGGPIDVPKQREYIFYNKEMETKSLPNVKDADIDTTLLVYSIQTQISKATQMFYIKGNEIHTFKNSSWAIPVSKMLTVAIFEYLLDHNVVNSLAFQDINIRQDFTLSGTTPYGPVLDLDNNQFFFYITFYLKNEKNGETKIKTIKYRHEVSSDQVSANEYAELTSTGLSYILAQLRPWLIKNLKVQKNKNKNILTPDAGAILNIIKK